MAYSQKVVDRFESVLNNPQKHSVGRFDPKDPNVATGMVGAPACGDVMKLQLKLSLDNVIEDVKFKTYGCGSAIASSTMFVDMLKGKTIEEAKLIKDKDFVPNHMLKKFPNTPILCLRHSLGSIFDTKLRNMFSRKTEKACVLE